MRIKAPVRTSGSPRCHPALLLWLTTALASLEIPLTLAQPNFNHQPQQWSSSIQQQKHLNQQPQSPYSTVLPPRPSLYAPVLKVPSLNGYLDDTADAGTPVRVAVDPDSAPMQILVDDKDLVRGMPPAVYQYILTGYEAERVSSTNALATACIWINPTAVSVRSGPKGLPLPLLRRRRRPPT